MSGPELLITVALGLAVNEVCDVSPWVARRLATWAARLWSRDTVIAAEYAEEWQAIIEERPGKLFKLFTAFGFVAGGIHMRLRLSIHRRRTHKWWGQRHASILNAIVVLWVPGGAGGSTLLSQYSIAGLTHLETSLVVYTSFIFGTVAFKYLLKWSNSHFYEAEVGSDHLDESRQPPNQPGTISQSHPG